MLTEPRLSSVAASQGGETVWGDVVVFCLPLVQCLQFHTIGNLLGSDILFVLAFLCLLMRRKIRLSSPLAKRCVLLILLWLAAQVVTDIVRRSAFEDYARGWSKILLTLIAFTVLYPLLYGRRRRILLYGWGLALGAALLFWFNPDRLGEDHPWKFGISYPITLAVFLWISRRSSRTVEAVLLAVLIGLLNVYLNARSRGGFCLATAAYLVAGSLWRRRGSPPVHVHLKTILVSATAMILAGLLVISAYEYAAGAGLLGNEARRKYEAQASGKFGILLGGRSDLLGAFAAVYDSPLLGHGSWARDPRYVLLDLQAMAQFGYENTEDMENELVSNGFRIPAHSFLLEGWVESGLAGAVFWGWVFLVGLGALLRFRPARLEFSPIAAFGVCSLLWDIAFTSYGSQYRLIAPYYIVILMTGVPSAPRAIPATLANGLNLTSISPATPASLTPALWEEM